MVEYQQVRECLNDEVLGTQKLTGRPCYADADWEWFPAVRYLRVVRDLAD